MKVLKRFLPLGLIVLAVAACSNPAADYDAQEVVNSANGPVLKILDKIEAVKDPGTGCSL